MNGATQLFFIGVAYGHLISGVPGGSGGDEPSHPWHPRSVHEADAVPAPRRKPAASRNKNDARGEGPCSCPVCGRRFSSDKAAHGHMRSHPDRPWRGMEPPRQPDPAAAGGKRYRYACERCGAPFETRQALGGHRASQNGKRGCFLLSREPSVAEPRPVFAFDLNDPVPEQEEE